jgi:HEAT repeat protein
MVLTLMLTVGFMTFLHPQTLDPAAAARAVSTRLAAKDIAGALAAYDALVKSKGHDPVLLHLIASAELVRLSGTSSGAVRPVALEHLARTGDHKALETLQQMARRSPEDTEAGLAPFFSLLRLRDASAVKRVPLLLRTSPPAVKVRLIDVLQEADLRDQADLLVPLLDDVEQSVRSSAVLALGAFAHKPAEGRLRAMADGTHPVDRLTAAIALRRMGDTTMDARVRPLLGGILPEVRLMAAEAYGPRESSIWLPGIRELGGDRNELNRVRAAERMICCDPPGARTILLAALDSSLPSIRAAAARVLADPRLADAGLARRLLGHTDEEVRVYGAASVMALGPPKQR